MSEPNRAVFLSYASEDADAARRICEALRAGGVDVWFDQSELRGGDSWDREIRRRVHDCALFVAVISTHTEARTEGYFRREWRLAVDRTLDMADDAAFLLPVVVDDTDDATARVPDRFREVQWTRLPDGEALPAFVARVQRLLGQAAGGAATAAGATTATPAAPAARRVPPALARRGSRALLAALLAVAVAVAVTAAWQRLRPAPAGGAGSPAPAPAGTTGAVADNSIAVLPFVDLSEKKDQEYFSDGLAEELLDLLAKTPGLHVTARTSSFYFKGRQATVSEIAKTLGVAHLLEGSVRKAGNRLRVTTQLIRTDSGEHVWSETYDRELKDVFAVQDEIASAVVGALQLHLGGGARRARPAEAVVPEAYDQLLIGKALLTRGSTESGDAALAAFHEAVRLDPKVASAWAMLSIAEAFNASRRDDPAGFARAQQAANQALALDPALPEGYAARARLRLYTLDIAGAAADAAHGLELAPGDARVLPIDADVRAARGQLPAAIAALRRCVVLDPLNRAAWSHMGNYLIASGDRVEARRALERALALSPESEDAISGLMLVDLLEGHPERAAARFVPLEDPDFRLFHLAVIEHTLGHAGKSQQALDALASCCASFSAYQLAAAHAWRGETDAAFSWLERALRQRDSGLSAFAYDPLFDSVKRDRRYAPFLQRLMLSP